MNISRLLALLLFSTFAFGALLEGRRHAVAVEWTRLCTIAAVAGWLVGVRGGEVGIALLIAAACLGSAVALWRVAVRGAPQAVRSTAF